MDDKSPCLRASCNLRAECREVDDGDLLSRLAGKGMCVTARDKNTVVSKCTDVGPGTHIVDEEADIS